MLDEERHQFDQSNFIPFVRNELLFLVMFGTALASRNDPSELNSEPKTQSQIPMLRWSLIFLLFGLIAGLLGFSGVAGTAVGIAKALFVLFLVLFSIFLLLGILTAKKIRR